MVSVGFVLDARIVGGNYVGMEHGKDIGLPQA